MSEISDKHQWMVSKIRKPGNQILIALTPDQADLLHMAVGVSGESGELLDAVKRNTIYQKPLDRENVVEELGDIEFFLEGVRRNLCISRDETLQHNLTKLAKRYEGYNYTDAQAHARADKQ